jgi:hypothetical protein
MWQLQVLGAMGLALFVVYTYYRIKEKHALKRIVDEHVHPWSDIHKVLKGNNSGGAWRNRTWKPNPGFNDEFAGAIPGTCGQIRPGEWQCNCAEPQHGCTTLERLKSSAGEAEEKTDRRGAIAAQKARKKKG